MPQNITINGQNYSDVPAISVPKQGGGTASFIDETSAVLYTAQSGKTDAEKAQARTNIGAAESFETEQAQLNDIVAVESVDVEEVTAVPLTDIMPTESTNYIKFPNGTLICWGSIDSTGSWYRDIVLPQSYANTNYSISISTHVEGINYRFAAYSNAVNALRVYVNNSDGSQYTGQVYGKYITIGRWK